MILYEFIVDRIHTNFGDIEESCNTIRVKQGSPFSPILVGLYINELEEIIIDGLGNKIVACCL